MERPTDKQHTGGLTSVEGATHHIKTTGTPKSRPSRLKRSYTWGFRFKCRPAQLLRGGRLIPDMADVVDQVSVREYWYMKGQVDPLLIPASSILPQK